MKNEHYPFLSNRDKWHFEFESVGLKGKITKVVLFSKLKKDVWNLGFGDKRDNDFDDEVISNNGDLTKVMSTVFVIGMAFSERWPDRILYIDPVDRKRGMLYNAIFERNRIELEEVFVIEGFHNRRWRRYEAGKYFDKFRLSRKSTNFVKK